MTQEQTKELIRRRVGYLENLRECAVDIVSDLLGCPPDTDELLERMCWLLQDMREEIGDIKRLVEHSGFDELEARL